jgi:hypothetical protein
VSPNKSRTGRYLERKAIGRFPGPALDAIGKAVLKAVDKSAEDRWDRALQAAARAEGDTVDERVSSVLKSFRRELTTVGAATGAVAAAPALGTTAAASALIADLAWFGMRAADLIMTVGAIRGHTESTVEERRAWVLAVLAFGEEAATQFTNLVREIDASLATGEQVTARAAGMVGGDAATLDALRRINSSLASQVLKKYGTRRSVLAVGKLLPFGIGAVVGGGANYAFVRVVGRQADRFFRSALLLPSAPYTAGGGGSSRPRWLRSVPDPEPTPPPPDAESIRNPNPDARLTAIDRRNAIPTEGREK